MKAAIIQSNYLPWKGYFDIIHEVDTFVFEDDLQYTVRDWRNRNIFKTTSGPEWLTVPVLGGRDQTIDEVNICYDTPWVRKHLETLRRAYGKTDFFTEGFALIEDVLVSKPKKLSVLNQTLIRRLTAYLDIKVAFVNARDLQASGIKDDRLIDICKKIKADAYVSGPAAQSYIVPEKFTAAGIDLSWKDYSGYPEYPQGDFPFVHGVSVLDLIFRMGIKTADFIWGWRKSDTLKGTDE